MKAVITPKTKFLCEEKYKEDSLKDLKNSLNDYDKWQNRQNITSGDETYEIWTLNDELITVLDSEIMQHSYSYDSYGMFIVLDQTIAHQGHETTTLFNVVKGNFITESTR